MARAIERRLDLFKYPVLEREILEHGFDHEIGRLESRVVRRSADETHVVVELQARDLPAREPLLQHAADRREPLADARRVGVLEANARALLHGDRRDARAHEAGAEHAERVNLARANGAGASTPGSFFSELLAKNKKTNCRETSVIAISPNSRDSSLSPSSNPR